MPGVPPFQTQRLENLFRPPVLDKYIQKTPAKKKNSKPFLKWMFLGLGVICTVIFVWMRTPEVQESFTYLKGPFPDFIGREKYLNILSRELVRVAPGTVRMKVIWGRGGYGKSELAVEFANRFRSRFSLIWTFYCDSEENIHQGYRDLANKLGILNPSDSFSKIREKVHFYLENHHFHLPWLLLFDNVEEEFKEYPQRGGAILITSQKKVLNPEYLLEIHPFSKEESIQLLEKITHEPRSAAMEEVFQDLEGIPLLLNYAAHYIKATPGCGVSDYHTLFSSHLYGKEGPLWNETDVNRRYFKSLFSSWQFPLKALEKENPLALQWLYVCSYLYPEHIQEDWIDDWLKFKLGKEKPLEIERKEILKTLQDYGIIKYQRESKTFYLHRFFQHMIRDSREAHAEDDLKETVSLLEKHEDDYNFFKTSSWQAGKNWHLHAVEIKKWLQKYPHFLSDSFSIKVKAGLYESIGIWDLFNYRYHDSTENLKEALNLRLSLNENSFLLGEDYSSIGWALLEEGNLREASEYLAKGGEILQLFVEGEQGHRFADNLNSLGLTNFVMGNYETALTYFRDALAINEKREGNIYQIYTSCNLNNIGRCLFEQGHFDQAERTFDRSIQVMDKSCDTKHPYYLWVQVWKADCLSARGDFNKALPMIEKALAAYQGPEHGELNYPYNGMGVCYFHLNQFKKAKEMFKKGCYFGQKYFGKENPYAARSYPGLGWSYLKEKKVRKGVKYLLKSLTVGVQCHFSPEKMTKFLTDFQEGLKEAIYIEGKTEYVKHAAAMAGEISEKVLGKEHILTRFFQNDYLDLKQNENGHPLLFTTFFNLGSKERAN